MPEIAARFSFRLAERSSHFFFSTPYGDLSISVTSSPPSSSPIEGRARVPFPRRLRVEENPHFCCLSFFFFFLFSLPCCGEKSTAFDFTSRSRKNGMLLALSFCFSLLFLVIASMDEKEMLTDCSPLV